MEEDLPAWVKRPGETNDDVFERMLAEPYRVWGLEPPGAGEPAMEFDADVDGYVGRSVRIARRNEGIGQAELADAIGMTQRRLSRIELAQSGARVAELVRLAIQLRRPLAWFVEPPESERDEIVRTGWERVEIGRSLR